MSQPIPPSATAWWNLFYLFLFFAVLAGGIVLGIMIYFIRRYRYREDRPETTFEFPPLRFRVREAIILASLSGILLFSLSIVAYRVVVQSQYNPPPPGTEFLTMRVTAFQWAFKFTYPNNVTTLGEVRVPSGQMVLFNVTSSDVMHNFGIPAFKLKIDAIPGVYNTLWVTTPPVQDNATFQYQIRCYELCGAGHTNMMGTLTVMNATHFTLWLAEMGLNQTGM